MHFVHLPIIESRCSIEVRKEEVMQQKHRPQEEPRWVMQEQIQHCGKQINPPKEKDERQDCEKKEGQAA